MADTGKDRPMGRFAPRRVLMVPALMLLGAATDAALEALVMKTDPKAWVLGRDAARRPSDPAAPPVAAGVGALGRLEPGWKVHQVAPAATDGAVEALFVEEGDSVKAGTVIAVLDTHARRQAALEEAAAQVRIAAARLALVKAGTKAEELVAQQATIEQLRASLFKAEADFKRAALSRAGGATATEDYDFKKSQVDAAKATLRHAEAVLASLRVVRPEDVAVAEAELVKAEAGVGRAGADLDATKVCSPIAGRVLKLHSRAGERVAAAGVVEIGDTDAMHAVAEVYERDAPRVRVGQRAVVKVQSLPGELTGAVIHIGSKVGRQVVLDNDPVKDTDARVVEVRVRLDAACGARVAGLTYARVEVRIDAATPPEGR